MWTLDTSATSKCQDSKDWDPSYKMCMKTKLPNTKTVTFKAKSSIQPQEINWDEPALGEIPPITPEQYYLMGAYRAPCYGDSGSGQMFLTYDKFVTQKSSTFKFVLAAVFHGKETYTGPCGTYRYNKKKKDYVDTFPVCHSISNPKIYNWIKKIIKI